MSSTTPTWWLQPGHLQPVWLARGTHLLVQRGGVRMSLHHAQPTTVSVPAGSAHELRAAGWVWLEAIGRHPAEVLCIAPAASPRASVAALCDRLLGACARGLHHLGPLAGFGRDQADERR